MKPLQIFGCFLLFLSLLIGSQASATHIMGGDFNYRYIEKDSFEFTIVFYVDCENGDPGAIASDKFAIIGFFNNRTKDFIEKVEIERSKPERVSKLNYACVTAPPNACVDRYEYTFRKRIEVGKDGIIAAFQRCCRNHTITNLIDPGYTGMTWLVTIPSIDVVEINSNPVFKASPPNFLCNDAPLIFDHSAIDEDGDSLSYELYIPFEGATRDVPRPSQPSNPDYKELDYSSGYGLYNMMGGKEKLKIDSKTGQLTVYPNKVGQYVVGIKVIEYRDGKKIGESLRDYQFNVLDCNVTLQADFEILSLNCHDTLINVKNKSKDAASYTWQLIHNESVVSNSDLIKPAFKTDEKGIYKVKLKVKNTNCEDSVEHEVEVGKKRILYAGFEIDYDTCDVTSVRIKNFSDTTENWYWDIDQGNGFEKNKEVKNIEYSEIGDYTIRLRLTDSINCADDVYFSQRIKFASIDTFYADFQIEFPNPCDPGELVLTKTDEIAEPWNWTIESHENQYKNEENIRIKKLKQGKYSIELEHENSNIPCALNISEVKEVEVLPLKTGAQLLKLYNVFSPNEDGLNDCFGLDMLGAECYVIELTIFNRWGEKLFHTDDASTECWKGRKPNGELYPASTYFGVVHVRHDLSSDVESIPITITLVQ